MKIVPTNEIPFNSKLGQNIYRHDGLLALPKGISLRKNEIDAIKYYGIDFVIIFDEKFSLIKDNDINFTLNIIEDVFIKTTLWDKYFGKKIYDFLYKKVMKNRKVQKMLNELRKFDTYSFAHCINVSLILIKTLKKENVEDVFLGSIGYIALLHDIGRLKMSRLFHKEGKLTEKEFEELKKHPIHSYKLLKKAGFSDEEVGFVLETHERWDGLGYPMGLKGKEISEFAQLILIADIYNALSSFRPYREVYDPYQVTKMIERESKKSFEPGCVNLFLKNFTPYYKGLKVELNNGEIAIIKSLQRSNTLPIIQLISKETGEKIMTVDLSMRSDLRITNIAEI